MSSSGNLSLQQSDFVSSFVGSFQEIRRTEELFDVTLACEDKTVEAHKVVLSACSPFFRHVFKQTKQTHPFIYLRGVFHLDLVSMLDYIYTGEAEVPAGDVGRFISAAQELKIKGLVEEELKEPEQNNPLSSVISEEETIIQLDEAIVMQPEISRPVASPDDSKLPNEPSQTEETEDEMSLENERLSQLKQMVSEMSLKVKDEYGVSMWKCKDCEKVCKKKDKMEAHIEHHHSGLIYTCKVCNQKYKSRSSLKSHETYVHKEKDEKKELDVNSSNDILDAMHKENEVNYFKLENEQDEKLRTEIGKRIKQTNEKDEGKIWQCTECGRQMKKKYKMEYHIETHLEGFSHVCVHCDKMHKTRGALRAHISITHRGDK